MSSKTMLVEAIAAPTKNAIVGGPFGSNLVSKDYTPTGVPVIRGQNMGGKWVGGEFAFVSNEKASELEANKARPGDLVFTQRGTLGQVAIVPPAPYPEYIVSQSQMKLTADASKADVNYLYYVFCSSEQQEYIRNTAIQTGVPHTNLGILKKTPIVLPSLTAQREIASVLCALDDRIALLRETNATLEAIAQALFKSWFVDFDPVRTKQERRAPDGMDEATAALFPDAFEESELGLVPRGWRIGTLADCCTKVESGGTPRRTMPEYWNGDIAWLTSGEVRNAIVFDTKERITGLGVKDSAAKLWPEGTTVVAMYGATAGEVCMLALPTTANQACCGLLPKADTRAFLFLCVRKEQTSLASKSSGSAQQNLNKRLVSGHKVIIPSDEIISKFEALAGPLLDGWIQKEQQLKILAELRDTLLPRLISGQLRLPEVEAEALAA